MSSNILVIDGENLTIEDVYNVGNNVNIKVALSPSVIPKINTARAVVEQAIDKKVPIYGVTTGFGNFSNIYIQPSDLETLNHNLITSHTANVGEYLPSNIVRMAMLIRINALIKGHSGTKLETINTLLAMLNEDLIPLIRSQGSLSSSGDLCLLSQLIIPMLDIENNNPMVYYKGRPMMSLEAFTMAKIERIKLSAKEGLSLNNGSSFTAAFACHQLTEAMKLLKYANLSSALTLEAVRGVPQAFDARIHKARNHEGQIDVANMILRLVQGSGYISPENRIQDAYSLRCIPQVHGAILEQIRKAVSSITNEINAATDNPLIFGDQVISGGNFHGENLGFVLETMKIALTELGNIAERRIARLVDDKLSNGLPCMLAINSGLNSGYMIAQYTAVNLTLENQQLSGPDIVHSLPTAAGQEDFNANAMNAARHLERIITNVYNILSIELVCAARGITIRKKYLNQDFKLGIATNFLYEEINKRIPFIEKDHVIGVEFQQIQEMLCSKQFDKIKELNFEYNNNEENDSKNNRLILPSGTRDFHPEQQLIREEVISYITNVFKKYGAVPIDTPVFELRSVLFGKYGDNNKLVFDLMDQGGQLLSLRYDLTVPFARYMAMYNKTSMKRYHVAKVYRRDNPSMSQGRFREFYQLDLDIAGKYDLMVPDAEVINVICEVLNNLLGKVGLKFLVKLNHKRLLDLMLEHCGVAPDKIKTVCSSIDKLDKEEWKDIAIELLNKGILGSTRDKIGELAIINGDPTIVLKTLKNKFSEHKQIPSVLNECEILFQYLKATNNLQHISFDLSLARGLDYYTGMIFEVVIVDNQTKVGSIAAGGRYDNLIGQFGNTQIPAVGGSLGIERIFTLMESKGNKKINPIKCLVVPIGKGLYPKVMEIAHALRNADISTEFLYNECKMKDQLEHALNNNIQHLIIVGENEVTTNTVQLKNTQTKAQLQMTLLEAIKILKG